MEKILNGRFFSQYIDWFYNFIFYYSEEKSMKNKIKAIAMAVTPILLAIGYIILIAAYFITGG